MANTFITPTKVAKEALMLLKNSCLMGGKVHRDYKSDFSGPKTGNALQIRKPNRYTVTDGATISIQDSTERYTTIPQPSQKHIAMAATSAEMTMEIEEYSERHIAPAMSILGNRIDSDLLGLYDDVPMAVGTPGTDPNSFSLINSANVGLNAMGVPNDGNRHLILNPEAEGSMADAFKGFYDTNLTQDAVRRGETGRISGFNVGMSQNVKTHTTGTYTTGSTPLVNGTVADGATSIVSDGWANSTLVLKAGDIITVANVYEVNDMNKQATSKLKQFVVQSDVTSDGSGNATIPVMDSGDSGSGMQDSGAYQNVSAHAQNNAAIYVNSSTTSRMTGSATEATGYAQNLAFHKNAFALVMFDLEVPSSAEGYMASDPDTGFGVRCIKDYDVTNDREILRLDVLYSVKTIYPDLACRVWGG